MERLETDLAEKRVSDKNLNKNFQIRIPVRKMGNHPDLEISVYRIRPKKTQPKPIGIWLSDKMDSSPMKTKPWAIPSPVSCPATTILRITTVPGHRTTPLNRYLRMGMCSRTTSATIATTASGWAIPTT